MKRLSLAGLLLCTFLLGRAPFADAEPEENRGVVSGRVTILGEGIPAVVSIRLRLPNIGHFYNFPRQAAWIHRRLASTPRVDRPWRTVVARAGGWFRIEGLVPACYDLRVEDAGGGWGGAFVPVIVPGQHVEIDIPLLTGGQTVHGRVRYADGRPFRGRVIAHQRGVRMAFRDEPALTYSRWTQADDEGRFHLAGLSAAPTTLVAHRPGHLWQHLPSPVESGEEIEFVLDDHPRPLRGRVLDIESRKPIAGAKLAWIAWWDGVASACGVVTSDADGHFLVPRPRNGTAIEDLHVHAPGYGRRRYEYPRGDGSFVAYLRKAARIEGRVVDPEGRGVPNLHVRVEHRSWDKRGSSAVLWTQRMRVGLNEPVTTDANGRFVHGDLDWGDADLFARGRGWVPAGLVSKDRFEELRNGPDHLRRPHTLRPGETLSVTLRVERGAVLRGVLRDPAGRPVVGVPLRFDSSGGDPLFDWLGFERPFLAATDAQGCFTIESLLPGSSFELQARRRDYPKVEVQTPARTLEVQPPVELVGLGPTRYERALAKPDEGPGTPTPAQPARHGRWILLRVVAADTGKPIAGAHVHAMMHTRPGSSERFEIEWTTDEDGRVRLGPFAEQTGDVNVERAEGYIDRNQIPFGMPTREGKPFTVELKRACEIRGRVLLPDGHPVAGARVRVRNLGGGLWAHYVGAVRTEVDGSFSSGGHVHAEVEYELKASYWDDVRGYEAETTVLGAAGPKEIRLRPIPGSDEVVRERRERLRIRVLDAKGRPVPRARVRLGHQAPSSFEDGIAVFGSRVTAEDGLSIFAACAEDGWPLGCGPLRVDPVGRATGTMVVRLPPEQSISGVLLDPDGVPMRGVQVKARVAATSDPKRPNAGTDHGHDRTDAKGRFRLRGLGNELYELRFATPEKLLPPTPHLSLRPSSESVVVRLREPVAVRVRLLDAAGQPVAGAKVTVGLPVKSFSRWGGDFESLRSTSEGTTDASGAVILAGIDPHATYRMQIRAEIDGEHQWMQRDDWLPRAGDVVFEPE